MAPGKSQKFVNVRREQVQYDENGIPVRPPPEYNPLRPEASGLVLKSGAELEAIVDASSGKIINPHVPLFIAKAPWYSDIKHVVGQRKDIPTSMDTWYDRGAAAQSTTKATKYRKGACENCGAMTHKTKDCLERPRKVGAKYTGKNIAADEVVQNIELGFEAKRDRWNGFDATDQLQAVKEWELVEEKRQQIRLQKGMAEKDKDEKDSDDDEEEEDKKDADGVEQKVDEKNRMTVRNLRIREDTAKYLRNLDLGSAYYDPKTRSMRENPYAGKDPNGLLYAGDNFERYTSQVKHVTKLKDFAWEKNVANAPSEAKIMSLQSNPTQAEQLYKKFEQGGGKAPIAPERLELLEKYGGQVYLEESVPRELLVQSEEYVEYNAAGDVVVGNAKSVVKSRWPEDVLLMNHTHVWGSFYEDGEWGFACCQSTVKGSYCGGSQAIEAKISTRRKLEEQVKKLQQAEEEREEEEEDSKLMPPPTKSLADMHKESLGKKGPAQLQLERIEQAKAAEEAKLQEELYEIREREKQEKKAREREALERAQKLKIERKMEDRKLKAGFEKSLAESSAQHQSNLVHGYGNTVKVKSSTAEEEKPKFNPAAVLDLLEKPLDDMTPYLPADANIAKALKAIEQAKVQAQGAQGFSYLRKKRKWEMTDEELEAQRTLQHHADDPMAKFIKQ